MDSLTNKQKITYSYTSRYSPFYCAYNKNDGKYMYFKTKYLNDETSYVLYKVNESDNLDYLANKYYGRPDLYWVIADFNRIQDAFIDLYANYKTIKIPTITDIEYLD